MEKLMTKEMIMDLDMYFTRFRTKNNVFVVGYSQPGSV